MFATDLQQGLDPQLVGAKSANLGRAMELGFSVPIGGILTRHALRLFLREAGLLESAQRLIDTKASDRTSRVRDHEALCERILAAPIPQPVIESITPIIEKLLAGTSHGLAVRSSGVHEDSTTASFAGVYDSFLGLQSNEDLWMAVRRCWCGFWSPQAIDYARKMGVTPDVDGMAVLIQMLVPADSAGVLFTANPRTGNPWEFVLEACFGLAQDLVASTGSMPVDRFFFEWDTGKILQKSISEKTTELVSSASGLCRVEVPTQRLLQPSLSDETANRIASLGLMLDQAFGCRIDIEWAVEGDRVYIVQVRPITVLPQFFPHQLPAHLANRTWRPAQHWHFRPICSIEGKVMPPLYRDKLITEKHNRYNQIGPVEMPVHLRTGVELDFHGHRYMVTDEGWPEVTDQQRVQYLIEYEPQMRHDYLEFTNNRIPTIKQRAAHLEQETTSLSESIEAMLWTREEMWDCYAITAGPSQTMSGLCLYLLSTFIDEHLPDVDVNDLVQGHHPDLDPYFPQVQVAEAEGMARLLEPERHRFERMELSELIDCLMEGKAPAPFIKALENYCERFGLMPPSKFETGIHEEKWAPTMDILRLIRNALNSSRRITEINKQATHRRKALVATIRKALTDRHEVLVHFERFYDWALFWGPALNNRAWVNATSWKLSNLWDTKRRELQKAGLIDKIEDIGYFTVEDLKLISATNDIEMGQRLWQRRRIEYERYDRLDAPPYLGKAPEENSQVVMANTGTVEKEATSGTTIVGRPCGPGRSQGTVRKIERLDEGDEAREKDVVVIVKPIQSRAYDTPFLFSLMLRVRGLVVLDDPMMWMHHVGQIARECQVPIVQISNEDIARIPDGCQIDIDGSRGTVTLMDSAR